MSGRQLPQNALKYSCNLPQDLRVTWSRTTSGKSSPLLYRKSNWNQSQSIPCSLDEGVRIIRNHSRVSPWPQYSLPIMGLPDNEVWHLPALCNILNGMTSRFVIFFFFKGRTGEIMQRQCTLFEEKFNWPKAIFFLHRQNNKQMLTHFDWLPNAVTHEVSTDRRDARCPST